MLVAASACGYGSGPLFAKGVYAAHIDWLALLYWRFLIGAALGWAWVLATPAGRAALAAATRRHTLAMVGLGAFFVGNAATYYAALETLPASLTALIVYIYPALVAVLSIRFGRGLHGRRPWLALAIAMAGVSLTIGGIDVRADARGLALAVASPIIYAVYIILSARLAGERRGATAAARTRSAASTQAATAPALAAAVMMTGTLAVIAAMALAGGEPVVPAKVPASAWPGLIGIAVLSTFVAIQGFYAGAARIGAAQAALVSTIEPVYTISLALAFFGERLSPLQGVGAVLVLGGVLIAQSTSSGALEAVREEP